MLSPWKTTVPFLETRSQVPPAKYSTVYRGPVSSSLTWILLTADAGRLAPRVHDLGPASPPRSSFVPAADRYSVPAADEGSLTVKVAP